MNRPSWFPFGRRKEEAEARPEAPDTGRGAITSCGLADVSSLMRPFAQDPFCRLRPPFSREALERSLELADTAYTLELDPWQQAGWNDFSILIDDSLHSGMTHAENGDAMRSFLNAFKLMRAKAALREVNPVAQLMSAMRQKEKSDTVKAVCMMHPVEDGRFLLAIGFMGTGKRFYDWFSNLRFATEEGFHQGFYQLCDCFEDNAEEIVFPAAARALGLEKLTLGEVLLEMRSLSSRFRLWMAGHSQGGAVMQVFAHRLITDWGVLPQNMVGYGFASPTVATGRLVYDPAAYPLYHLLNADDVVPRMGALLHLGMGLEYRPDDAMRTAVYEPLDDPEALELLRPFREGMTDTPSVMLHAAAFLMCLAEEKGEDGLNELASRPWAIGPVDRVILQAGDRAMDLTERAMTALQEGYACLMGGPMEEEALQAMCERMRPAVSTLSIRRLLGALGAYSAPPHRIVRRDVRKGDGAYAWIVRHGADELRPFIWDKCSDGLPVRRFGSWADTPRWPLQLYAGGHVRSGKRRARPMHGRMRRSFTAQKQPSR